jgi:hypothetical protein
MKIELKKVKLDRSKILQMTRLRLPLVFEYQILCWVNIRDQKVVIIKSGNKYYRCEYLESFEEDKIKKLVQVTNSKHEEVEVNLVKLVISDVNNSVYHRSIKDASNSEIESIRKYKYDLDKSEQVYY